MNGLDFCKQVAQISDVPIIFLSAVGEEATILKALDCGAIDYIVKPVKPCILHARVKLALRISALISTQSISQVYNDGYLMIDPIWRQVRVDGESVRLTKLEFAVLLYLFVNGGKTCAIGDILVDIWGDEYRDATGHVYTYIRRLRKKLEPDPQSPEYILSDHGTGYRFRSL